jgi:hypothetical protein
MLPGRGAAKGASFEREICRRFSKFVSPGTKDTVFWRSAQSGGRATIMNRRGHTNETQLGDLTCVHEAGLWLTNHFIVECKHRANLQLEAALFKGKGKLAEFWIDLCKLSRRHRRHPMLVARQNRCDTMLILDQNGAARFSKFRDGSLNGNMLGALATLPKEALIFNFEKVVP